MVFRFLFLLILVTSALGAAYSQTSSKPPQNPNDSISADKGAVGSKSNMLGSPEDEMLARQGIKAAEKDHRENVERAREAAQLSAEIRDSYLRNKSLSRTDLKKLERLEKVTRKIRSEAGGSDGDITIENPPTQLEPALSRIAEVTEKLRKGVEKTPRQVVSALVIENANEVLEILRLISTYAR